MKRACLSLVVAAAIGCGGTENLGGKKDAGQTPPPPTSTVTSPGTVTTTVTVTQTGTSTGNSTTPCVAGEPKSCSCLIAGVLVPTGTQYCNASGQGYSPCVCPAPPGTGGTMVPSTNVGVGGTVGGTTVVIYQPAAKRNCADSEGSFPHGSMKYCEPTVGECRPGTKTCNDGMWSACDKSKAVGPKPETCNNRDDDCNGKVDDLPEVGSGCMAPGVCGLGRQECDLNAGKLRCSTGPGASDDKSSPEVCDGKDNDCDGKIDNGFPGLGIACTGLGACASSSGVYECTADRKSVVCSTMPGGSANRATAETCTDMIDNDCDGIVNDGCDCMDGATQNCGPKKVNGSWNYDGLCNPVEITCKNGKWPAECKDANGQKAVFPAPELCDGLDNDCDGGIDDGFGLGNSCEGVGECGTGKIECDPGSGGTRCSTVKGGTQYHSMPELCDGKDNDCDGAADEDFFVGVPCRGLGVCGNMSGEYECDGLSAYRCSVGPNGSEDKSTADVCSDLVDNDCDGDVNEDCACQNGQQEPCGEKAADGSWLMDGVCHPGVRKCEQGKWNECEGAVVPSPETCNNRDDDCDGLVDNLPEVGTNCRAPGVCGRGKYECDLNAGELRCSSGPGASGNKSSPEICDGLDNDCDGKIDNGFPGLGIACNGLGVCASPMGVYECSADHASVVCSTAPGGTNDQSSSEICDTLFRDEDCDGSSNEECVCVPGVSPPIVCGNSNIGECHFGSQLCNPVTSAYDPCVGSIEPAIEVCNGKDDDCDGTDDNGLGKGAACNGVGECGLGALECDGTGGVICSTDPGASKDQSQPETCDGLDNDCNGYFDENGVCGIPGTGGNAGTGGSLGTGGATGMGGSLDGGVADSGADSSVSPDLAGTGGTGGNPDATPDSFLQNDAGTGGNIGTGGNPEAGGASGTGGATATGGSTGVIDGGSLDVPYVYPTVGEINCQNAGLTVNVTINGAVSVGLVHGIPATSITDISLGMAGCWDPTANACYMTPVDGQTVDTVPHTIAYVLPTRFTPYVHTTGDGFEWFQLRNWLITGDCAREGCENVCKPGEVCVPLTENIPDGCIIRPFAAAAN